MQIGPSTPVGAVAGSPPPRVAATSTLLDVAGVLRQGGAPVALVGPGTAVAVGADDIVRALATGAQPSSFVAEMVVRSPLTVPADAPVVAVLRLLTALGATHAIVVDGNDQAVGTVGLRDLGGFVAGLLDQLVWAIGAAPTARERRSGLVPTGSSPGGRRMR